jgi:phage-related protein
MKKVRQVIAYKSFFKDFLKQQTIKVQNKIFKIIEAIEIVERIPERHLKKISGVRGLYEIRILLASNTWRVLCFFDKDRLVILLNGFSKKTQKTPKKEIDKALRLMNEYYYEKKHRDSRA